MPGCWPTCSVSAICRKSGWPPEEVRELRRLVHYRQTLAKERKNLKLQIGATLREARQKSPANTQSVDQGLAGPARVASALS